MVRRSTEQPGPCRRAGHRAADEQQPDEHRRGAPSDACSERAAKIPARSMPRRRTQRATATAARLPARPMDSTQIVMRPRHRRNASRWKEENVEGSRKPTIPKCGMSTRESMAPVIIRFAACAAVARYTNVLRCAANMVPRSIAAPTAACRLQTPARAHLAVRPILHDRLLHDRAPNIDLVTVQRRRAQCPATGCGRNEFCRLERPTPPNVEQR